MTEFSLIVTLKNALISEMSAFLCLFVSDYCVLDNNIL